MKPCANMRALPWVVHESVRSLSGVLSFTNIIQALPGSITFKAPVFMRSGLFLSLVASGGVTSVDNPFHTINNSNLKDVRFETMLSFGWSGELGKREGGKAVFSILDKKLVKDWLDNHPKDLSVFCYELLNSSEPVRFMGDEKIKLFEKALNILNDIPLKNTCKRIYKKTFPTSFLNLFMEVSKFDNNPAELEKRLEKIGPLLHEFFHVKNNKEKIEQEILSKQFFSDKNKNADTPYFLEKFIINYASNNDDVVLIKALHENISFPWNDLINDKYFLNKIFADEKIKIIAYFLHTKEILESSLREVTVDFGNEKLSSAIWANINQERMNMALPFKNNFIKNIDNLKHKGSRKI